MPFWRKLLLLALFPGWHCGAADRVEWFVQDAPPINIRSGPYRGQGAADRWIVQLSQQMPEFEHHIVESSFARAWHDINRRDGLCVAGSIRSPERDEIAIFSDSLMNDIGIILITRRDRQATFNDLLDKDGRLDLAKLGDHPELAAGIAGQRALPPVIDHLLHAPGSSSRIESLSNQPGLFGLLRAGRIDFLFGSDNEADYFGTLAGMADQIITYEVAGAARNISVYVACSNQPIGRAVVAKVNLLLKQPGFRDSLQAIGRHWHPEPLAASDPRP